jgi:hypothetical protein
LTNLFDESNVELSQTEIRSRVKMASGIGLAKEQVQPNNIH